MLPDSKILIATINIFGPTAPIGQLVGLKTAVFTAVGGARYLKIMINHDITFTFESQQVGQSLPGKHFRFLTGI
jgi:hypothetical protein